MFVATKTLDAIKNQIESDQGAKFRENLRWLMPKMEDAYRGEGSPYRKHLGASLIGGDCARDLWYGFKWAKQPRFPERILRLFNRGHLEEARFLSMLMCADCDVWFEKEDGGQYTFHDVYGHFGSSLDGVIGNVPDLPAGVFAYGEFKTSSSSVFKKVKANGVRNEKWEHFIQCQTCMHKMNLPYSLYIMVNKDNDELHAEILEYDPKFGVDSVTRAGSIVFSNEPPPRIANSHSFFKCRMCNKKDLCHLDGVPDVNCRTCAHSTPLRTGIDTGEWECALDHDCINTKQAFVGCEDHLFNPHMLNFAEMIDSSAEENYIVLQLASGKTIVNGKKLHPKRND